MGRENAAAAADEVVGAARSERNNVVLFAPAALRKIMDMMKTAVVRL